MYAITTQCRVLEVSPSGYYAWLNRSPSKHRQDDVLLGDRIESIHWLSRSTYGRPRVHAELRADGIAIARQACQPADARKWPPGRDSAQGRAHDGARSQCASHTRLVERNFTAQAPDQL